MLGNLIAMDWNSVSQKMLNKLNRSGSGLPAGHVPAQMLCTHFTLLRLSRLLEMRTGSETTTSADCNIEDTSSK